MNKVGFGFLRLPTQKTDHGEQVDQALLAQMVDEFLAAGGTYFDTAYTYLNGDSERAVKTALVDRHPRSRFILADKLPSWLVQSEADCERYFQEQLQRCGVSYFDVYLLHWLNQNNYAIAEKYQEFTFIQKLKENGYVSKIGFSFHDSGELLDQILTAHPEVDYVQLQINYLDWESSAIQSEQCYKVAEKHGKAVTVMEPVKGGTLAVLPEEADQRLQQMNPAFCPAIYAIRFAQSLPQVEVVLSGMNTLEQVRDNMRDLPPLTSDERRLLKEISCIINNATAVPCTGCGYCVKGCPKGIAIPDYFKLYNEFRRNPGEGWKIRPVYRSFEAGHGLASSCIGCRQCENQCPQS